jgi:hypothetical protein
MTWYPPLGSRELPDEPGCWESPRGAVYVAPETWEQWERERHDPVRIAEERERWEYQRRYEYGLHCPLSRGTRRALKNDLLAQGIIDRQAREIEDLRGLADHLERQMSSLGMALVGESDWWWALWDDMQRKPAKLLEAA